MLHKSLIGIAGAVLLATGAQAAAFPHGPSVVQYWGQNSAGAGSNAQQQLGHYCDGNTDAIIVSFLDEFNLGGLPVMNLANSCWDYYSGTQLLHCPTVGQDIKTCQQKGVKILLSLGGASGAYGFQNDQQAVAFADTLWNLFGKGQSNTRPFDDAVVDGFDLDIEGGGSTGYVAMVNQLRNHFKTDSSKQYFITAAPQCPFPDAILGSVISSTGFDAVNVQFYNNYCSPLSGNSFNFDQWDNWAKNTSPNKDVKVFLAVPGSPSAAGTGYVPFNQLKPIVESVASKYSSYGGVTVWDASQSYGNTEVSPNFATALHNLVDKAGVELESDESTPEVECPKEGEKCSTEGKYACAPGGYGLCQDQKWAVQACTTGTTCFSTTDGESIYCGQSVGGVSNSATCPNNSDSFTLLASDGSTTVAPRPYKAGKVFAELSVSHTTASSFEAVINARRLDTLPFGSNVVVEFTAPPNVNVSSVSQGSVKQSGRQVTAQIRNPKRKSMSVVFSLKGSVNSGVFVAPDANSMTFKS
ncbi:Chitinase 1 [Apophysomyces sp. BC1034]|nr:Chitinase 1 [Apophysomyces sp. BC1015]KAG0182163.1 Chitinase 1 [Apophysomyces sp. BC1021]KAG0192820.1 Chitinase 1 [Apophysomyces sp. BC1034]